MSNTTTTTSTCSISRFSRREDSEKGLQVGRDRAPGLNSDGPRNANNRPLGSRATPEERSANDIPIIGMSAHALASEREKAIATGCDEFDAKPIEFERLVATIRRVLANPNKCSDRAANQIQDQDGAPPIMRASLRVMARPSPVLPENHIRAYL